MVCFLAEIPVKFYKQRIIESFIVDFIARMQDWLLNLTAHKHYTEQGKAYDEERSAILHGYGLKVLRFSNRDVNNHFDAVCETIDREVQIRI